ncbi:MAG: sulfotransferase [Balneolaceae bacterium]|nr:sulfotransferase [Balneolaceae bacterium]
MNEEPIFILGAHKSGTTLLRSIFDGHPALFVIPFESHFFQNLCYWIDYDYRKEQPRTLTDQEIINRFRERLRHLNETEDKLGDTPESFEIDLPRFMRTFGQFSTSMTQKEQFELFAESVHQSLLRRTAAQE